MPEFIFCHNVEVIDDSKTVQVKNLTSLKVNFMLFVANTLAKKAHKLG